MGGWRDISGSGVKAAPSRVKRWKARGSGIAGGHRPQAGESMAGHRDWGEREEVQWERQQSQMGPSYQEATFGVLGLFQFGDDATVDLAE